MDAKIDCYYFSKRVFIELLLWILFSMFVIAVSLISKDFAGCFIAVPLIGLLLIVYSPRLFRRVYLFIVKKPAIIISEHFLVDNVNTKKLHWLDICSITFSEKKKAICINIFDTDVTREKYARQERWFLARWLTNADLEISHGTFYIAEGLVVKSEAAFHYLTEYHDQVKKKR
jgi:hypothetical protein